MQWSCCGASWRLPVALVLALVTPLCVCYLWLLVAFCYLSELLALIAAGVGLQSLRRKFAFLGAPSCWSCKCRDKHGPRELQVLDKKLYVG